MGWHRTTLARSKLFCFWSNEAQKKQLVATVQTAAPSTAACFQKDVSLCDPAAKAAAVALEPRLWLVKRWPTGMGYRPRLSTKYPKQHGFVVGHRVGTWHSSAPADISPVGFFL